MEGGISSPRRVQGEIVKSRIEELASSVVSGYTSGATVEQVEVAILTAVNEALELAASKTCCSEAAEAIRKLKV
jgi:predicted transcriptional regulator